MAGESVLVHGASGGVGIAAVQLARAAGMTVIGTAGTERGRKLVLEQGAQHVLDHTVAGYLEQVMSLTEGRGVDVILEMLANVNLGNDLNVWPVVVEWRPLATAALAIRAQPPLTRAPS